MGETILTGTAPGLASKWRLDYFPIGLFGSVMGLTGLSVAWHLATLRYDLPIVVANSIAVVAVSAFVLVSLGYVWKIITAPEAVRTEFHHPIAGNLFGTLLISLLLLPIVLAPYALLLAQITWSIGAIGMVLFAWLIVSRWMSDRQQVAHATPAWIVPVVGLLDVPLALPGLGLPPMHAIMVLGLAVGLFFAIPLFTLIFSRLVYSSRQCRTRCSQRCLSWLHLSRLVSQPTSLPPGRWIVFAHALYRADLVRAGSVLLGRLRNLPVVLPVPRILVGGQLPACRLGDRRPSFCRGPAQAWLHGCHCHGRCSSSPRLSSPGCCCAPWYGVLRGELRTLSS